MSFLMYAQDRTITGTITGADNETLVGVTILLEGTNTATTSDADGRYVISVPQTGGNLVFSFVGYETQIVSIGDKIIMDIQLRISQQVLDELVVMGYGSEIKTKISGSVSQVKSEDIALIPVSTVEQTLQGKAAGVFIEANNGKVGSSMRIRIRGSSSINANSEPLFVVDGIPINTVAVNDYDYIQLNPLNDLDFNNIESVEILKDASAAAIYGSRGANGVIIITTKRGKAGNAKITVDYQQGFSKPTRLRDFMNAEEYVNYYMEAAVNAGIYDYANNLSGYPSEEAAINAYINRLEKQLDRNSGWSDWEKGETDTDWQSLAFQKASSKMLSVAASGGTDKLQYYTSYGYSSQDGIMLMNHADRISAMLNLDAQLNKKTTMGLSLQLSRNINNDIPDDNSFSTPLQLVALQPITPVTDTATGEFYDRPTTLYYNGLIETENTVSEISTYRTIGNLFLEYKLLPGLKLRGEAGADVTNLYQTRYSGSKTIVGLSVGGYGESFSTEVENINTKLLLVYNNRFNNRHNLNITGGVEYQNYEEEYSSVDGQGFPNDKLQTLASAAQIVDGTSVITYYRFLSYFARALYDLDDKYLFTLTGRMDGSSRFGQESRYGFFPSASAGWILSREDFLKNLEDLSFLKLRTSYGITGNAGIGNFNYLGLYGVGAYGGESSLSPITLANPDLTWERTAQWDIGVDFGLFNDRLNGEVDYYIKNTTDLLLDVPVPASTGFTLITQNIGSLNNKGIEFVLNGDILVNVLKWSASLNFAANRNEITALANGQTIIDFGGSGFMNIVQVGQPIGVFYGAEYAGVNPDNGDALFYVNDPNGGEETTTDFNEANYVIVGDPNPDFIAGFSNSFFYRGFGLDFLFQSVYG
ncbi:MAG: SusC/RagA family TonB-linked outer membrane protein, partial [Chitinophagales bacterium]